MHRNYATTPGKYYISAILENCNDVVSQLNLDFGKHLNEKGRWVDNPIDSTYYFSPRLMYFLTYEENNEEAIIELF